MEFKGTKGNWEVKKYNNAADVFANGKEIAQVLNNVDQKVQVLKDGIWITNPDLDTREMEANAKLIAASPVMLDALQKIATNSNDHAMIRIAIKAIEKALK